jgi:hypothetical protein
LVSKGITAGYQSVNMVYRRAEEELKAAEAELKEKERKI